MHGERVEHYECATCKPKVHICRGLQSQDQRTEDMCPDDLRSTHIHPRESFCTDVQMSLQCRMCRGAMRFVLGINTLHCSNHKTKRGLEELPIRIFCFTCYPISPVQKNVHSLWHEGFTSIEPQNIQGEGERWGREREGGAKKVGVFLVFSAVDQFEWSECWAKSIMPS